jgi:type IV pilus assembly protein PilN
MIKINLLPQEERKRRQPVGSKKILGILGGVVAAAAMGYGWWWLGGIVDDLQGDIKKAQAELKRYEALAKQVDKFQADKKRLEEKLKIIQTLVAAQGGPVKLLDEVSKALPNDVWLTAMSRSGKKLDVSGIAFSNFSIANFMTNLSQIATLIQAVDLVVSEKAVVEQVPVERFTITMELKEVKG